MADNREAAPADTGLIARARNGDDDAFAALYRHYAPGVYRYVFFRVSSREEAEDITETVFFRAWQSLPAFREAEATFAAWLYRVARNAVIDHYRTRKRHDPIDRAAEVAAPPGPEVEDEETAREVRVAVSRLPDEQREVVLLRFIEGLSHAEVATALGKTQGACRVLQHRALKALCRILDGRV